MVDTICIEFFSIFPHMSACGFGCLPRPLLFRLHHARLDCVDWTRGNHPWHVYRKARWMQFPPKFFPKHVKSDLVGIKKKKVNTSSILNYKDVLVFHLK
jgi:hypothetical protein